MGEGGAGEDKEVVEGVRVVEVKEVVEGVRVVEVKEVMVMRLMFCLRSK